MNTNVWSTKFLTQAGRLTHLKSNIQSIPSYAIQTNLFIKKGLQDSWQNLKELFFEDYVHLKSQDPIRSKSNKSPINWDILNLKKSYGGLGICKSKFQNMALVDRFVLGMLNDYGLKF